MSAPAPPEARAPARPPLLEVRGLRTEFQVGGRWVPVVDGVSLSVSAGETLGLVGESGSGKSVTALSVLRLLPEPPARIAAGEVHLAGQDLLRLGRREMRAVRGRRVGMVFQEPMTAINPVLRVGAQVVEGMRVHLGLSRSEAEERAVELLRQVGIPSPAERMGAFPHQLSGGMKQRVMIAAALACDPEVLIADEPTTALDVTIQAQILRLIDEIQAARRLGVLLITHDLGVVAESCDRVAVLYAGRVAEEAGVDSLFRRPAHPYTVGLFGSLPRPADPRRRLEPIPGVVPAPAEWPTGCRFRTRCPLADGRCAESPELVEVAPGHRVACHHRDRVLAGALDGTWAPG